MSRAGSAIRIVRNLGMATGLALAASSPGAALPGPSPAEIQDAPDVEIRGLAPEEELPAVTVEPCCTLCPRINDTSVYQVNEYTNDFFHVVAGREGWLFRTKFDLTTDFELSDDNYKELSRLTQALKQRGTTLVLVYQPSRGLMDGDKLLPADRAGYNFELAKQHYSAALREFRDRGGLVVAPLDNLIDQPDGQEFFFRRDHHWTPHGAQRAAEVVAASVRQLPVFASIPKKQFVTQPIGVKPQRGSLQKFASQVCGHNYSAQYAVRYATRVAASSSDDLLGGGNGSDLLGEGGEEPQIVLVGTSNSDTQGGYNFAGYLEEALGADVLNVAMSGGGIIGSMMTYFASEAYQQHPPKILIWEMPHWQFKPDYLKIYRQAVPMVGNGCRNKPALIETTLNLHKGNNELLFNGKGGKVLPITGRRYLMDMQFSDMTVKDVDTIAWLYNGQRETLKIHFDQYVDNKGRFVAELRHVDPEHADTPLLNLNIEVPDEPAKATRVTTRICEDDLEAPPIHAPKPPPPEIIPSEDD